MKYRKKPLIVEAIRWNGDNNKEVAMFLKGRTRDFGNVKKGYMIIIPTLEGDMRCNVGDWIIKGVEGEFYPCKDSIFKKTYEKTNPMKQSKKETMKDQWEKEFDSKWYLWNKNDGDDPETFTTCGEEVKSFIYSLLQIERQRVEEMLEKIIKIFPEWKYKDNGEIEGWAVDGNKEIIKIIEEWRRK